MPEQPMNKATRQLQFEMALDQIREGATQLMQFQAEVAPLIHNYYEQLVKAGFTEIQALHIVAQHGCMPPTGGTTK